MTKYAIIPFLVFIMINFRSNAQNKRYFIEFTDRINNPYSINQPQAYLSQRAINRRISQNIPLVENDLPVNPQYVDSIKNYGVTIITRIKWLNGIIIETNNPNKVTQISSLGFVKNSRTLNREGKRNTNEKFGFELQNENQRNSILKSNLNFDYGSSEVQVKQIGCDCLHNLGYKGENKIIAVLDAGFPNANVMGVFDSALSSNRIRAGFDFVDNNNQVFDDHPHGTYVLSCMASEIPGQIIGTAPKADYILIRTEDAPTEYIIEEYYWVAGAEFADSAGADIINSSLGYTTFDDPGQDHSYQEMDGDHAIATIGADIAASKGMVVNVGAGNSGNSSWYYIGSPADADSALTVGAVDDNGIIADFSSRGPAADGAIKPNVMAMGLGSAVVDPSGQLTTSSGTSFSTPINAGAVACLWEAFPQATNMQLIDAIQRSGSYYSSPNNNYGYGIPNYCLALSLLTGNDPRKNPDTQIDVLPNPFKDKFSIQFYSKDTQTINLNITDVTGKIVFSEAKRLTANSYNIITPDINTELSDGNYNLWIKSEKLNERRKLIKISKN